VKSFPSKKSQRPSPPMAEAVKGNASHTTILIRYSHFCDQTIVVPNYEAEGIIRFFNAPDVDRRHYSNKDKWVGKK